MIIVCPKLDETEGYIEKLAEIIKENELRSLTVAVMTVPCCTGQWRIVERAVEMSGVPVQLQKRIIHIDGKLVS